MLCVTDYKFRRRKISMMTRVDQRWLYEGGGKCNLGDKVKIKSGERKVISPLPSYKGRGIY